MIPAFVVYLFDSDGTLLGSAEEIRDPGVLTGQRFGTADFPIT